ncbi:hypothetical protein K435DRAFT_829769 [Dendrothele bispora CBS 962.96]|uniref:MoaB/Mog domain-containing protein n=1 Tax=Dendrothele bispora (strain CBS 962.96) TaxID=1314807 RepID=A0A4S8LQZ1_DENBC|nr:hypothetical protein K435DRAFT_829769 [Dendrothele bispora CBS 962.96]
MNSTAVAVLTVSDTASGDSAADKSGPTIKEIFGNRPGFECVESLIVPDEITLIQKTVKKWVDNGNVDWIITTGGTGFGVRDRTPEAISPLLEREASGIVHLLLASSLKYTPLAALSRPVAGTIKNTLIVTLPGSVKAVKENLDALLSNGVIEHAIDLIKGGTGKQVHASMGTSHGHDHHHHHHHHPRTHQEHQEPKSRVLSHDPSLGVSTRNRVSPYPLVSLENALEIIDTTMQTLPIVTRQVNSQLKGHVLAEDVYAPANVPPKATTSVDGYALRSTDPPGIYKVLTSKTHQLSVELPQGCIYRINTGGQLPAGADTVIMVEDTKVASTFDDDEEKEVETLAQVDSKENVRDPGSDVRQGDLVLQKGERITSQGGEIGTLAFVGRKEVKVYRKPIVAILSTGNEVMDLETHALSGNDDWGIWDTNRPSMRAALEGMGYDVVDLGIAPDEIDAHVSALKSGLSQADIILTTGGTSMGPTDLLKPVIERQFGGTVHFGRVTIKPGKPTTFASVPLPISNEPQEQEPGRIQTKQIFALPGNPASALVTFYVFVVPALRKLGGWPNELCQLPRVRVQLQTPMRLDPRTEFHRVIIRADFKEEGVLKAFSTGGQRSSRVASLSGANGLVVLPQKGSSKDGKDRLEVGEMADAMVIGDIQMV